MRNQLFDAVEVAASQNETSLLIVLGDGLNEHAIQYKLSGSGTATLELLVSIEGEDYVSSGTIASGLTSSSGPGSDGKDILPLSIKPADLLKLKITETGGANSITISAYFVQK